MSKEEKKNKSWIFTFGHGQANAGFYVEIETEDYTLAREIMLSKYCTEWRMIYPTKEAAGVARWSYRLLETVDAEVVGHFVTNTGYGESNEEA